MTRADARARLAIAALSALAIACVLLIWMRRESVPLDVQQSPPPIRRAPDAPPLAGHEAEPVTVGGSTVNRGHPGDPVTETVELRTRMGSRAEFQALVDGWIEASDVDALIAALAPGGRHMSSPDRRLLDVLVTAALDRLGVDAATLGRILASLDRQSLTLRPELCRWCVSRASPGSVVENFLDVEPRMLLLLDDVSLDDRTTTLLRSVTSPSSRSPAPPFSRSRSAQVALARGGDRTASTSFIASYAEDPLWMLARLRGPTDGNVEQIAIARIESEWVPFLARMPSDDLVAIIRRVNERWTGADRLIRLRGVALACATVSTTSRRTQLADEFLALATVPTLEVDALRAWLCCALSGGSPSLDTQELIAVARRDSRPLASAVRGINSDFALVVVYRLAWYEATSSVDERTWRDILEHTLIERIELRFSPPARASWFLADGLDLIALLTDGLSWASAAAADQVLAKAFDLYLNAANPRGVGAGSSAVMEAFTTLRIDQLMYSEALVMRYVVRMFWPMEGVASVAQLDERLSDPALSTVAGGPILMHLFDRVAVAGRADAHRLFPRVRMFAIRHPDERVRQRAARLIVGLAPDLPAVSSVFTDILRSGDAVGVQAVWDSAQETMESWSDVGVAMLAGWLRVTVENSADASATVRAIAAYAELADGTDTEFRQALAAGLDAATANRTQYGDAIAAALKRIREPTGPTTTR